MQFNVIYTNSGPRAPMGGTQNQTVASLGSVNVYMKKTSTITRDPIIGNSDAASVIKSNGESIGNAQLINNPLPPGVTS